jgi:hypothetical protein
MPAPLPESAALAAAQSLFFCSNMGCPFHVTGEDSNVRGFGDWATLEDGTTVSHCWVSGRLLCDLCARAVRSQLENVPVATDELLVNRSADFSR